MADASLTIEGNSAFDNSFQNNGTIADEYIQCTNAYIQNNYTTVIVGISKHTKRASEDEKLQIARESSTARSYPKYLKFRSRIHNTHVQTRASYDTQLRSNWISTDIVRRLGLKTSRTTHVVQVLSQGRVLRSTGECVHLSYSKPRGTQPSQQEFYVMEDAPFDLLFGIGGDNRN